MLLSRRSLKSHLSLASNDVCLQKPYICLDRWLWRSEFVPKKTKHLNFNSLAVWNFEAASDFDLTLLAKLKPNISCMSTEATHLVRLLALTLRIRPNKTSGFAFLVRPTRRKIDFAFSARAAWRIFAFYFLSARRLNKSLILIS